MKERSTASARWARAHRLAIKVKLGTITPEEQAELAAYEASKKSRGRRKPVIDAASSERPAAASSPPSSSSGPLPFASTKPFDATSIDPTLAEVPVIPPAAAPGADQAADPNAPQATAGAAPLPPGAAPAGTPLAVAMPAPLDPAAAAAAKEFAAGIGLLCAMGLEAALEVWPDKLAQLPPRFRLIAQSDEAKAGLVKFVEASAERVALKYGLRADLPMRDELVVGAAVAGSSLALARKWTGDAEQKRVDNARPAAASADGPDPEPARPSAEAAAQTGGARPPAASSAFAHLVGE